MNVSNVLCAAIVIVMRVGSGCGLSRAVVKTRRWQVMLYESHKCWSLETNLWFLWCYANRFDDRRCERCVWCCQLNVIRAVWWGGRLISRFWKDGHGHVDYDIVSLLPLRMTDGGQFIQTRYGHHFGDHRSMNMQFDGTRSNHTRLVQEDARLDLRSGRYASRKSRLYAKRGTVNLPWPHGNFWGEISMTKFKLQWYLLWWTGWSKRIPFSWTCC